MLLEEVLHDLTALVEALVCRLRNVLMLAEKVFLHHGTFLFFRGRVDGTSWAFEALNFRGAREERVLFLELWPLHC